VIIGTLMIKYHFDDYYKRMKRSIWDTYVVSSYGNSELLLYLNENGYKWDELTWATAAINGYLDCIKFLHENGCPLNEKCCINASDAGHLEVLKYLHENG